MELANESSNPQVVPAVGVGCTVLLKPSEIAPMSSLLFAEFMEQAGFPAGVFNLVNGDGPTVGEAMSRHPDIDMMSFTGSTRAGIAVTKAAADTVKRIALELGGKGPNLVFADTDVAKAVKRGVLHMFNNSGQSCNAPSRMIVEKIRLCGGHRRREITCRRSGDCRSDTGRPSDWSGCVAGPV